MRLHPVGLIVTLALALLVVPLTAAAQQPVKVPRIGYLGGRSPAEGAARNLEALHQGLRELGYSEGQNLVIEYRWPESQPERRSALAAELVQLQPDVILASGDPSIRAVKEATTTIPLVMVPSAAPVENRFVASLARPGGNLTGVSIQAADVGGKRLALLKDALPQASRVAVLRNAADPGKELEWRNTQEAARRLGVTLSSVEVRGPDDFDPAFAALTRERPDALVVFSEPLTLAHQRRIVAFATQHQLPMISEIREFAVAGALMTYGASLPALFRRAAYYVDRLLKGTKPADLPVEQPWTFELVLNRKTAQALGVTFPLTLLVLADEVLE